MYLTLAIPCSLLALLLLHSNLDSKFSFGTYILFFTGPLLTYFGTIGVLTGFNGGLSESIYFGITFYTIFIAYHLSNGKNDLRKKPWLFIISTINPIYLFTGPIPNKIINGADILNFKRIYKRFSVVNSDLILGIFFSFILAPAFMPYFYLKQSTRVLDIILFGIIFELYVYFNFAGFSMIAWSAMRIFGLKVPRNFRQPFSADSIVDYWQRWHISLSIILKALFFEKFRPIIGMYGAVIVVYMSSALWHGVSANFVIWGLFHSFLWCLSHYLHKRGQALINGLLLIGGIIIGRVIFSEIEINVLHEKIAAIINIFDWRLVSEFIWMERGIRPNLNLIVAISIVLMEILRPRIGLIGRDYEHLKSPWISAFIGLYTCLTIYNHGGVPIYGNR